MSITAAQEDYVWRNMACMCVKTRRLDVAAICLARINDAKAVWAMRQAEAEPEEEARVAMLAVQVLVCACRARVSVHVHAGQSACSLVSGCACERPTMCPPCSSG